MRGRHRARCFGPGNAARPAAGVPGQRRVRKGRFRGQPGRACGAAPAQAAQTQAPIESPAPEQMEPERTDSGPRLDLDIDSLFREAMPPPPLTVDTAAGSPDDTAAPALTYEQASGDPAPAAVAEQAGASEKEALCTRTAWMSLRLPPADGMDGEKMTNRLPKRGRTTVETESKGRAPHPPSGEQPHPDERCHLTAACAVRT